METFFQIDGNILLWIQEHIRNPILDPVFEGDHASGRCGDFLDYSDSSASVFQEDEKSGGGVGGSADWIPSGE